MAPSPQASLLGIPVELRQMIFVYLVEFDKTDFIDCEYQRRIKEDLESKYVCDRVSDMWHEYKNCTAVMSTCQTLYAEGLKTMEIFPRYMYIVNQCTGAAIHLPCCTFPWLTGCKGANDRIVRNTQKIILLNKDNWWWQTHLKTITQEIGRVFASSAATSPRSLSLYMEGIFELERRPGEDQISDGNLFECVRPLLALRKENFSLKLCSGFQIVDASWRFGRDPWPGKSASKRLTNGRKRLLRVFQEALAQQVRDEQGELPGPSGSHQRDESPTASSAEDARNVGNVTRSSEDEESASGKLAEFEDEDEDASGSECLWPDGIRMLEPELEFSAFKYWSPGLCIK
ncbi:MAG: hypothetical protein Q9227_002877 [Pyrenula ochraceoflavens]